MEQLRRGSGAPVEASVREAALASLSEAKLARMASTVQVRLVAESIGVDERTVWRWLQIQESEGRTTRRQRQRLELVEQDVHDLAFYRGNLAAFVRSRRDIGPTYSYETWRRAFRRVVSPGRKAGLRGGERVRRERDTYLSRNPIHRNECWEADHTQLAIAVVLPDHRVIKPWATIFVDSYSRVLMGFAIVETPSRESILAGLRAAMMVEPPYGPCGGIPLRIRFDRGRDFLSDAISSSAGALGVETTPLPGYTPHLKGRVERANLSIEQLFLEALPGYTHGARGKNGHLVDEDAPLLSLEALVDLFSKFAAAYNAERPHSALHGQTPLERWATDPTPIRVVTGEKLRHLLLASARRIVGKQGIRFRGHKYNCPELCGYVGQSVEIRYMPHHMNTVEVFWNGQHLGTASILERFSPEEVARLLDHRKGEARWLARELRIADKKRREKFAALTAPGAPAPLTMISEADGYKESAYIGDQMRRKFASRSLANYGPVPLRMVRPRSTKASQS